MNHASKRYRTVKQLVVVHPAFTASSIRNLVHRSDENGLAGHITRIGRKVLIDLDGFDLWLEGAGDSKKTNSANNK